MEWGSSWHCTGDRDQHHSNRKEMQESKMAVWGGLTNSCEKKRREKQRRKGKIYLLLPPIPPSVRVFSKESTLRMSWPKYWSFSFSICPSNEHPGLISFRMDWLDLLDVQGTLKNLLQHHTSKASILWHSAFFTVQLSHPYMATEKPYPWLDGPL